jgi:hypothetical protein
MQASTGESGTLRCASRVLSTSQFAPHKNEIVYGQGAHRRYIPVLSFLTLTRDIADEPPPRSAIDP